MAANSILPAALLGALLLAGCFRSISSDEAERASLPPPVAPWSVEGVRLMMTQDAVRASMGREPDETGVYLGNPVWAWRSNGGELSVTFDRAGKAVDIFGRTLLGADGRTIVGTGFSESDVVRALGKGKMTRHYRPKGNGVISLARELEGIEHEYRDAQTRFTLSVIEDQVRSVRALPLNAK